MKDGKIFVGTIKGIDAFKHSGSPTEYQRSEVYKSKKDYKRQAKHKKNYLYHQDEED